MAAWFKKNTGITSALTFVSSWADQSGNGRDLLQAVGANQPTAPGDGTVLFDGLLQFLKCAAFTLPQPVTIYLRMKQITWVINDYIFDGNAINSGSLRQDVITPTLAISTNGTHVAQNTALALNTYGSVAAVLNGASGVLQINSTTTTGNVGAGTPGGFTLGSGGNGLQGYTNIQVAEVIIYNVAHDASTRATVIAYLDTL